MNGTVQIEVLQDRNATVARATLDSFAATGSSKRNKEEKFDAAAGRKLAIGRALRELAREIERSVRQ